jgi:hypothetical protein
LLSVSILEEKVTRRKMPEIESTILCSLRAVLGLGEVSFQTAVGTIVDIIGDGVFDFVERGRRIKEMKAKKETYENWVAGMVIRSSILSRVLLRQRTGLDDLEEDELKRVFEALSM